MAVSVSLLVSGLAIAVVGGLTPEYTSSSLVASGSFFALAGSGSTLYAASDNGGSVVLEVSTDQGRDWSGSPVPYSAVAGGSPWSFATVNVDGSSLLLTAATSGSVNFRGYPGLVYPVAGAAAAPNATQAVSCGTNSTVLIASSQDLGLTWSVVTINAPNASITSLQAGLVAPSAAVAWVGDTTSCDAPSEVAGAVSSSDSGRSWSPPQDLGPALGAGSVGHGVEMAPDAQGLLLAYSSSPTNGSATELNLWRLAASGVGGFSPLAELPAPSSWTLQGSPDTSAYLLTPTYLIPLENPPYTALPFDQLQGDGSSIGSLPTVVSLVPTGPSTLEVAATTADDLGVDCWTFELVGDRITQTCHVELGAGLPTASAPLPIVALLDGGGWWVAIGASGGASSGCTPACVPGGGAPYGGPAWGNTTSGGAGVPASIGTSVCYTGCSSAQGLAAYSFAESSASRSSQLVALGAVLTAVGAGALGVTVYLQRTPLRRQWSSLLQGRTLAGEAGHWPDGRAPARRYLFLAAALWALSWSPLVILAFDPPLASEATVVEVAFAGAILGSMATAPLAYWARRALGSRPLPSSWEPMVDRSVSTAVAALPNEEETASRAHASWAVGVAVGLAAFLGLLIYPPTSGAPTGAEPLAAVWGLLLAGLVLLFLAWRVAYYRSLLGSALCATGSGRGAPGGSADLPSTVRWGTVAFPFNPLVGLLLGWALSPLLPFSLVGLDWVALVATLLGGLAIAIGILGTTEAA